MVGLTFPESEVKSCVYCAEVIQAKARKCRYCGEFLNTKQARELEAGIDPEEQEEAEEGGFLFAGRPSLFGLAGTAFRAVLLLGVAYCLMRYAVENSVVNFLDLEVTDQQLLRIARYRFAGGFGLAIIVAVIFGLRALRLKMIHYEVTSDRIEYSRGVFNRRVDNLDMLRVVDLRMRRTLFDCVFGIGTVTLTTSDKSDPEFKFEKIRGVRELYDVIKEASLEADRKSGVIHIE